MICTCKNIKQNKIYAIKFLEIEDEDESHLQKEIDILKESEQCDYTGLGAFYRRQLIKVCSQIFRMLFKGQHVNGGSELLLNCLLVFQIVMEFCDGGSCLDILRCQKTGALQEEYIAPICAHVVQGLIYLHSNKIMHRDLKVRICRIKFCNRS